MALLSKKINYGIAAMYELATGTFFNNLSVSWGKMVSPVELNEISILFIHSTCQHFLLARRSTLYYLSDDFVRNRAT